jgi:phosphoglycolate phosphatase
MRRMTTLILFDIDGTLFTGQGCGRAAVRQAMTEIFGTAGALDSYVFGGRTDWATLITLLGPLGFSRSEIDAKLQPFSRAMGRCLAGVLPQFSVSACPGSLELVQALRARPDCLLGILTGNVPDTVPIKLSAVGFDPDWFPIGAYGDESPDRADLPPIALRRVVERCGRSPDRVVIVGDTPEDIRCARSIQARCIAVASGWVPREELEQHAPAAALDSLANTEAVLTAIFG